jgi:exodeoxyribonuclease V alpha subunit
MRSDHVPGFPDDLRPFVDAGVVRADQARAAAVMASLGQEERFEVVLALALALRAPDHGSVCVDLASVAEQVVPLAVASADVSTVGTAEEPDSALDAAVGIEPVPSTVVAPLLDALAWPQPDGWAELVATSPVAQVAEPGQVPLVVVEGSLLYLYRHWVLERFVAADLSGRAALDRGGAIGPDEAGVAEMFEAAARRHGVPADPAQVNAAQAASRSALAIISGGPGTGKTTTVATMLAAWVRSGAAGATGERIRLAAPTGKAAARMTEAIRRAAVMLGDDLDRSEQEVLGSIEATTVHRLLGRGRDGGFHHGPGQPIAADLVVVDEVSMVSLGLMAHLLAAVPPTASLVLVGDPDQLASVEAGSVLGDLLGRDPVGGADPGPPAQLDPSATELVTMHRVEGQAQIPDLAHSIRTGDSGVVVEQLRAGLVGVDWIDPESDVGASAQAALDRDLTMQADQLVAVAREVASGQQRGSAIVNELLERLAAVKVLCALRRGPGGVDDWNQRIERHLRQRRGARSTWYSGRPVMVLRNDYLNGVFNGDIGVAVRDPDGEFHDVWFAREPEPIGVPSARLGDYTTQWAMSIHKSQGSEFDHVVVTLPPPPSRILTRELLYTAVTRAKQRVTIVATEAAIREAVERPAARASGLTARLS